MYPESGNNRITISEDIFLTNLGDGYYIHTTWYEFQKFGRAPSNGLILIRNGKALLIDTPNNNHQTGILYDYLKDSMNTEITSVIVGHSHSDCMGGIQYLHDQGVKSISGDLTKQICIKKNLTGAELTFKDSLQFSFENEKVICRYFGGGHTIDNIVVYFPAKKLLFGGCLVRSKESKTLGNIKEAALGQWRETIVKIQRFFKDIDYIIPGHGHFGDTELLINTKKLIETYNSTKIPAKN